MSDRFAALVGRLSPKSQDFTGAGFGGIPTMTAQLIAGALADAQRTCGAPATHVFLLRSNDEMASRSGIDTHAMIRQLIGSEYGDRMRRHPGSEKVWPREANGRYPKLIAAVLAEWVNPAQCPTCKGRRVFQIEAVKIDCKACSMTGKQPVTPTSRAAALGVTFEAYRKSWASVWDWVIDELTEMSQQVERAGSAALRHDQAA